MRFLHPDNQQLTKEEKEAAIQVFDSLDRDDLRILAFTRQYAVDRRSNGMPTGCDPISALEIDPPPGVDDPYVRTERLIRLGVLADFGVGAPPSYVRITPIGVIIAREIIGVAPQEKTVSRQYLQHGILRRMFAAGGSIPVAQLKGWDERAQTQIMAEAGLVERAGEVYKMTEAGRKVLLIWERNDEEDGDKPYYRD